MRPLLLPHWATGIAMLLACARPAELGAPPSGATCKGDWRIEVHNSFDWSVEIHYRLEPASGESFLGVVHARSRKTFRVAAATKPQPFFRSTTPGQNQPEAGQPTPTSYFIVPSDMFRVTCRDG